MGRSLALPLFLCAALVLAACPAKSVAAGPDKTLLLAIAKEANTVGEVVSTTLAIAKWIDEKTTREGKATVVAGAAHLESLHLEARFRLPNIEAESHFTNAVLGKEVPGRRVTVKVRVDCQVRCSMNLADVRVERDTATPDKLIVHLPRMEVKAAIPDGTEGTYEVRAGKLRSGRVDSRKMVEFRKQLYKVAQEKAAEEFTGAGLVTYRRELAREVERSLRARFPSARIEVRY